MIIGKPTGSFLAIKPFGARRIILTLGHSQRRYFLWFAPGWIMLARENLGILWRFLFWPPQLLRGWAATNSLRGE